MSVIIEPYWNWNEQVLLAENFSWPVIIEPYWNWNQIEQRALAGSLDRYNWTLLELKYLQLCYNKMDEML